jgi:hypothetical protein
MNEIIKGYMHLQNNVQDVHVIYHTRMKSWPFYDSVLHMCKWMYRIENVGMI